MSKSLMTPFRLTAEDFAFESCSDFQLDSNSILFSAIKPATIKSRIISEASPAFSYLRIDATCDSIEGSVILYVMKNGKEVAAHWIWNEKYISFYVGGGAPANIHIRLRVVNSGKIVGLKLLISEATAIEAGAWLYASLSETPRLASKDHLPSLVEQLAREHSLSPDVESALVTYLNRKGEHTKAFRAAKSPHHLSTEAYRLYCESRLASHLKEPFNLSTRFNELGVFRFLTPIINSGMGDILTVGSLSTYFLENFGLQYSGTKNIGHPSTKRPYYQKLEGQLGLTDSKIPAIEIEIEDIARDLERIFIEIEKHKPNGVDTIVLKPKTPSAFSAVKVSTKLCKNFLSNTFSRSVRSAAKEYTESKQSFDLVLHARMGDVAVIKTKSHLINLYELQRGNLQEGLIDLRTIDETRSKTARDWINFNDLPALIELVRKSHPCVNIAFISDGLALTRRMTESKHFNELLSRFAPMVTLEEVSEGINSIENAMKSLDVDSNCIGEDSVDDFWNAISLVQSGGVLVSTARSFIFNAIAHFKCTSKRQIFFCTEFGGYFNSIENLNCQLIQLNKVQDSASAIANLISPKPSTTEALIDLAPYSRWHASSASEWERQASGGPNDGATSSADFSFHTELENEPFLLFDLGYQCKLETIHIYARKGYLEKSVPLVIEAGHSIHSVREIYKSSVPQEVHQVDLISLPVRYVKISLVGHGSLNLSSVRFSAFTSDALAFLRNRPATNKTILCHSPFYGLGGRLSVLATGFGAMIRLGYTDIQYYWGNSALLEHPREAIYDSNFADEVRVNLPKQLSSQLIDASSPANGEKRLSDWLPPETSKSPIVFISRNNLQRYFRRHEGRAAGYRRMYSNIIPSTSVLEIKRRILEKHNLRDHNPEALALQVRHGNGELYHNKQTNTWGVKPPSASAIIQAVESAISSHTIPPRRLVVASDCFAVNTLLSKHFDARLKIDFISTEIQNIGAGCNHLDKVFNKRACRTLVSVSKDDLQSFAEILVLASCGTFCGGKSFFVDAVIGFGDFEEDHIFTLDNADRYIQLDPSLVPLEQATESSLAPLIVDLFLLHAVKHDGVFIKCDSESKFFELYYFDQHFFSGNIDLFNEQLQSGGFVDFFLEHRCYA